MNDKKAAALIAAIQSVFPVLNLLNVVHLTGDDISILMLCVTNTVTFLGLLFQKSDPTF